MKSTKKNEIEASTVNVAEDATRCYSTYNTATPLAFDPMTELNLPKSYDEVKSRFNNLQGDRAMETLN